MALIDNYDYTFKINIVGDSYVGKTNLQTRYTLNNFYENGGPFIAKDFSIKQIEIENKLINCQVWDFGPGGERFKLRTRITSNQYLKESQGVIIIYDITNLESFNIIKTFIEEIKKNGPPNIKIVLVGNKCDLEDKKQVTEEEGKKLANELGINFFEVSAKTGKNVDEAFTFLVREIVLNYKES